MLMLTGFLHLIYQWFVALIILILLAVSYPVYRSWPAGIASLYRRSKKSWVSIVIPAFAILLIAAVFLPVFLIPLYPPTGYDATSYHLPLAKQFVTDHCLAPSPNLRFPVFTLNIEMLFTLALLFLDGVTAQLVSLLSLLVTVVAMVGWGKRTQSWRAGLWAGALVLSTPQIINIATTAYIDIGLMMFVTLAVFSFMNWVYSEDEKWLWLSSALLGLACGTKYHALFPAFVLSLAVLVITIKRRHARLFLMYLLIIVVIGAPWYIRNYIYSGNPVFPMLSQFFGYTYWSPADVARQTAELGRYGAGKDLLSLLLGPWNIVYHKEYFSEFEPISAAWLYLLPIALIVGNMKSYTRWLLAVAALYYVFWFYTAQVTRYLDPILPVYAIAAAISLDILLGSIPFGKRFWKGSFVAIIIAIAVITPGVIRSWKILSIRPPIPVNYEERMEFLETGWGMPYRNIRLYEALNQEHSSDYVIYALDDREMAYYADGVLYGDWFGIGSYGKIMYPENGEWKFRDSETIYGVLHYELGADYFLINTSPDLAVDSTDIPDDPFFSDRFLPVGVNRRDSQVYAILLAIE
jgi:hypothetical protein